MERREAEKRAQRERETADERYARFVNTNLSLITFCNDI